MDQARGVEVSYETIRRWTLKFGQLFAHNLRRSRPKPTGRWHLDEMVVKISGKRMYLWRSTPKARSWTCWSRSVATRRQPLRCFATAEEPGSPTRSIVTDKLASYRAAARDLGLTDCHRPGGMRENNRAENSHLPIRRRK